MVSFVFFSAAEQTLALPAVDVVGVLRMAAPTPVPGAAPWLRGLLNVRGAVMPVVDVAARLGAGVRPLRPCDHLLVASAGTRHVALAVDRVLGVREVEPAAVERPPVATASALVSAAVRVEGGLVLVHRPDGWLAAADAAASGG